MFSIYQFHIVTTYRLFAVAVPVVHAATVAAVGDLTVSAHPPPSPAPVAKLTEPTVPHLPQVVMVYIALSEDLTVDVGAGAYSAVNQHRRNIDASMTEERVLPHLHLVRAQEALAAEGDVHDCLSA